jgi:DNA-binding MarR family transcriptional regulator
MNFNSELLTLLKSVSDGYQSQLGALSKAEKLSSLQGTILSFLRYNDGLDAPSDIVRLLHLSKGDVSMAARALEKKGYLAKERDPLDQRKQHLRPLPKAEGFLRKVERMRQAYFASLFQGFDSQEVAEFKTLLERIYGNIHAK